MKNIKQVLDEAKTLLQEEDVRGDGWRSFGGLTIKLNGRDVCFLTHVCEDPEDMTADRNLGQIHRDSFEAGVKAAYSIMSGKGTT